MENQHRVDRVIGRPKKAKDTSNYIFHRKKVNDTSDYIFTVTYRNGNVAQIFLSKLQTTAQSPGDVRNDSNEDILNGLGMQSEGSIQRGLHVCWNKILSVSKNKKELELFFLEYFFKECEKPKSTFMQPGRLPV